MSGTSASIPASLFATVNPAVISAGGSGYALNGLILTTNNRVPIGTALSFPTLASVGSYFGATATEYTLAAQYFGGFTNSQLKPGALLFWQYVTGLNVAAWLRGGNVSGLTLAQLQALTGTLSIAVNGTSYTSSTINLASATSFSNAASIIQAAFTSPPFTVTYDSISGGFLFTTTALGTAATIAYPTTNTLATNLALTQATGAVLSQGAPISTPATAMNALIGQSNDWFSFMTTFEPINSDKIAFAAWVASQSPTQLFAYMMWDSSVTATQSGATSLAYQSIVAAAYGGTAAWYLDPNAAAFAMGAIASVDYSQLNGVATLAYKTPQSGLTPTVTSATAAANLASYGYNYYGLVGSPGNSWQFTYPGSISGQYRFIDAYANAAWLTNQLQVALMDLLTSARTIPYNTAGYTLIDAACADPIYAAVNAGVISSGVTLSALQAAEVNTAAGVAIDTVLSTVGWYLQVSPATAAIRAARTSPPISLWYTYAGSVQQITLSAVLVQ